MVQKFGEYRNFSSFVNDVIEEYTESDCYKNYDRPCFGINPHWRPFSGRCLHCDIPFDVIGRMETFEDDIHYIFLKNTLTHLFPIEETIKHYFSTDYGPKDTQDTLDTKTYQNESINIDTRALFYFSQLSKQQRSTLYEMYYLDFELFDYDAKLYGAMV